MATEIENVLRQITVLSERVNQNISKSEFENAINKLNIALGEFTKIRQEQGAKIGVFGSMEKSRLFCQFLAMGPMKNIAEHAKPGHALYFENTNELEVKTDSLGGYLVPDLLANDLLNLTTTFSDAMKYVPSIQINGNSLDYPTNLGGSQGQFEVANGAISEGITKTAQPFTFGHVTLTPKTCYNLIQVSDKLIAQSQFAIAEIVATELARGMGQTLDHVTFNGSGAVDGDNGGIYGAENVSGLNEIQINSIEDLYTQTADGTPFDSAPTGTDLLIAARSKIVSRGRAPGADPAIYANPIVLDALCSIKDSNGQPVIRFGDMVSAPFGSFLGWPLRPIEIMAAPGIKSDPDNPSAGTESAMVLLVGSLKIGAKIGYTRNMAFSSAPQAAWINNRQSYKVVSDWDVQFVDKKALCRVVIA